MYSSSDNPHNLISASQQQPHFDLSETAPMHQSNFHQYHRWKFHEWAVVPLLNKNGIAGGGFYWEEEEEDEEQEEPEKRAVNYV